MSLRIITEFQRIGNNVDPLKRAQVRASVTYRDGSPVDLLYTNNHPRSVTLDYRHCVIWYFHGVMLISLTGTGCLGQ